MSVRTLYIARHGAADALGNLVEQGRDQCARLAQRLSTVPLDAIWHSPLPRAADSAAIIATTFPTTLLDEAAELVDHIPYAPPADVRSPASAGFFDGYSDKEAAAGQACARSLVRRFAHARVSNTARPTNCSSPTPTQWRGWSAKPLEHHLRHGCLSCGSRTPV